MPEDAGKLDTLPAFLSDTWSDRQSRSLCIAARLISDARVARVSDDDRSASVLLTDGGGADAKITISIELPYVRTYREKERERERN